MSHRADPPAEETSAVNDGDGGDVAPTIRARDDIDGCGCLECRDVETTTINRSVLDALVWSANLFRSSPSIVGFAGVIILANRLLETNSIGVLPVPAVGVLEAVTGFAFVILIRAYVGAVVAGELTGDPITVREGLRRSVARTPALVGVVALVVAAVMTIPFLLSLPLFVLVGVSGGTMVELVGFPVAAAVGGVAFAVPFLFVLFKLWFAPEACVIGRYGPLEAVWVSWEITTNYRGKFVLVTVITLGSAVGFYVPSVLPAIGPGLTAMAPVLGIVSSSVGELLSIVWASAYAHVYVQGVAT